MRNFFVAILFLGAVFTAQAQPMDYQDNGNSLLKIRLMDNTPINVAVDGRYFNKRGTSITVGDLPPGKHFVKIYVVTQNRRGRGYEDVVYDGKVRTHAGMVTILQYDAVSGETQVDEQTTATYLDSHPNVAQEQHATQQQRMDEYQNGYDNGYSNAEAPVASPVAASGTLTTTKTDSLKSLTAAQNTDTQKMKLLRDALESETFTTAQVGTIMDFFEFESSKLDFAEWAYPKTVDQEAFSDLENKFTYQNYRNDLDNFLKSK